MVAHWGSIWVTHTVLPEPQVTPLSSLWGLESKHGYDGVLGVCGIEFPSWIGSITSGSHVGLLEGRIEGGKWHPT